MLRRIQQRRAAKERSARGVIMFSAQDYWYHNRAHSDVQLARALASDRPVLLVNSLGMRLPTPGNTTQPFMRIMRKVASTVRLVRRPEGDHPRLFVMTPVSIPVYGRGILGAVMAWFVRIQVLLVAHGAGIGRHPDLIITLPTAWEVARRIRAHAVVINRSDKYSSLPEADAGVIAAMEKAMLGSCDAAVYVSRELMQAETALVSGRSVYLGHGVDLKHFESGLTNPAPADIAAIPRPRVGFFGGIDDYVLDLPLIKRLSEELPDVSVVLVGAATRPLDELTSVRNLYSLGMRRYEQIPSYGAAFDVAIMPWLQNDWIKHCNPIKTKEYLALGLPVVTMEYPEADAHKDVIAIAHTPDDFLRLVRQAVDGSPVSTACERRSHVAGDSWDSRADVLRELLDTGGQH